MKTGTLFLTILCALAFPATAQQYSPENPYQPSAEKIETLKQVIPNFPEQPPMQEYTELYRQKFVVSDYPPGMFKYYVYVPENYTPQKKYTTLLLLHGGARHMYAGAEYFRQGVNKKEEAIIIVPIAPPGYDWNSAAPLALEALQDVAKNYSLNPDRIYLTGYSMGGIGTYSLLARYHDIFAAAFAVCGTYDPNIVEGLDDVPILIWHGEKDETFPAKISRQVALNLKEASREVSYIELAGATHADCLTTYKNTGYWNWLLKQRR